MYTHLCISVLVKRTSVKDRHRLNGYLDQRLPSLFLASCFRMCLNCEVLDGTFPWRTRFPIKLGNH